ncbi:MAG: putative acyl-CoA dehydrogenase [Acidimicrobiia bacterium]|nr:putative acyl-CoA dehydrogenase [Acidimicrobiia bacterium]
MSVTEELQQFRQRARAWLDANMEPKPQGAPSDQRGSHHYTAEWIAAQRPLQRKVFEGGFAGITWPPQYGGQGLTVAHEAVFEEEAIGFVMPDFGIAGGTTKVVCGPTILAHASEAFKAQHVPRMLAGDELWVQFFSEPGAGSDLAAVLTRAERRGDHWVLNGSKVWTSGAIHADYGLCLARTNWDVPKYRGLTWFAVSTRAPGVTVRPIREINGNQDFCEEFLDDVEIADHDVIGSVDDGWNVARSMMLIERAGGNPEARARRIGQRQLAPDLVALARHNGRSGDPVVRQLIARAHINDFVQEALDDRLLRLAGAPGTNPEIAAYGKLANGTYDPERARIGLEIGGAAAVTWPADRPSEGATATAYLNGRILSIAGGTNEMQRNAIAERILGLPREPVYDRDKPFSQALRDAAQWGSA